MILFFFLVLPLVGSEQTCSVDVDLQTDQPVTAQIIDGSTSYFQMDLSNIPEGWDITPGRYPGWCVQQTTRISRGVSHGVYLCASTHIVDSFSSFTSLSWNKINYIINHKEQVHHNPDLLQRTIWNYSDNIPITNKTILDFIKDIETDGADFCPRPGQLMAILVKSGNETVNPQRTFFECPVPSPDEETPPDDENGGVNHPPTADAQAGEPYQGVVDEEIVFDGSLSYDVDGTIVQYTWSFGDDFTGSDQTTTHVYTSEGTYNVTLTVRDNDGATDSYDTIAEIIQLNQPPSIPTVTGMMICDTNQPYNYTVYATDPDNDTIRYTIDWGDGSSIITDYVNNATQITLNHTWEQAGLYLLKTFSEDTTLAPSGTYQDFVFVDVDVIFLTGLLEGYLIDYGRDSILNTFHNNQTGIETDLIPGDDGWYLIDSDNDGAAEYQYHPDSGLSVYEEPMNEGSIPWLLLGIGLIIGVGILFVYFFLMKKQNNP